MTRYLCMKPVNTSGICEIRLLELISTILITEKWDAGCNIEIKASVSNADGLPFEYAITI